MYRVTFTVNGLECSVGSEVSSTTTLLDYIRNTLELRGTKYMCREAGCGACIVNVDKGEGSQGINACMVQITSCQDWKITTIEKVGNRKDGYHPIQTTLAENNGSQCGYCSPGWVMAMYSLLNKKPLTQLEIEQSLGSNVCRCTGYRPILEAFKKFGTDAPSPSNILDIEDLNICKKSGKVCSGQCDKDWYFVSRDEVPSRTIYIELHDGREFYRVEMLNDIFEILHEKGDLTYMLVAGNTGKGVVPIDQYPHILIDVTGVSELKGFYLDQNLVVGANTTLTEVMNIFDTIGMMEEFNYLHVLNEHLQMVAHIPVRNLGTLAGNLILKNRYHYFQSDIYLLLTTVGAQLTILSGPGLKKYITMEEFLEENMRGKIILNVMFPPRSRHYRVWTNKIMPRSQNAHAFVNCGFLYKLNEDDVVTESKIVYGGLSSEFNRAFHTEKFLVGKYLFNNETLQAALDVLDAELIVTPIPPNPSVEYRKNLALALFYKGLLALCNPSKLNSKYATGAIKLHPNRPLSNAQQRYETDPSTYPLNQPIPKLDGLIQCAGEAVYTEDLPKLPNEVFANFVLATVPLGTIVSIDPSEALKQPGVLAFYTASDIPGKNSFTIIEKKALEVADEPLLANGDVKFFNQPIGIIVAEDLATSERAAKLVQVVYKNVRRPVIDLKEAKTDSTRLKLYSSIPATAIGKDIKKILTSDKSIYWQYHFCMETLVCVTHPTEEGLKIYAATQWLNGLHQAISSLLNLNASRIDVFVRRIGGAYGYKISRESMVAAACSLVAYKLNRPCRFIQPLRNNMRAVGMRLPATANSEFGVNSEGVIQYINHVFYSDNGYILNEELLILAVDGINNCYDKSPWNIRVFDAFTDTASNTWCRSPGTLEVIAVTEWIMEQISYELDLNQLDVRIANIGNDHREILGMIETLKDDSEFYKRRQFVDEYNTKNRWKKRGLRFSLLRWTPTGSQYLDINLSVYHEDGSVTITHSGVEMGQGINTKAIQTCAYFLQIPVDKVTIKPNDTIICPNSAPSGGSLTTQNVTIGIRRCCDELLGRLEPIRTQLVNPTWEVLIKSAYMQDIDLQTHGFVNVADVQDYNIYGAVLCEVEVDILTGESEIIRVDLTEDVGRSINPELDVGQVEGAFIMGVGYWTSEQIVHNPETGEVLTDRTWEYWVPQARDIPQDFRIYFRKRSFSNDVILGAKATGEPATCLSVGVAIALREAIVAARSECGIPKNKWFEIDGPYTVEKVFLYSATDKKDFKFY